MSGKFNKHGTGGSLSTNMEITTLWFKSLIYKVDVDVTKLSFENPDFTQDRVNRKASNSTKV